MINLHRGTLSGELVPGFVVPFLMATVTLVLARFYEPLQRVTMSMRRWLCSCGVLGFAILLTILLSFPPNTDAALNATSSRLLWPSHIMLLAADPGTPKSGVAVVAGMSVVANVVAYTIIGLAAWGVAGSQHRN